MFILFIIDSLWGKKRLLMIHYLLLIHDLKNRFIATFLMNVLHAAIWAQLGNPTDAKPSGA